MVPRLLALLALLPLLLPPGLCACHAPLPACAGGHGVLPFAHLCLQHDGHGDGHGDSDPADTPHGHAPGCPAALDHSSAPFDSAAQVTAPDLTGFAVPPGAPGALPSTAVHRTHLGSPDEPSPLYLTLRTLRI